MSDVSFEVGPGVTALLGPNGAGKSTMLRMSAASRCRPRERSACPARTRAADVRRDPLDRLVPQQESVFEHLTAHRVPSRSRRRCTGLPIPREAAKRALERVDLDPADTRKLPTYSKGMRQRVKVAAGADPRSAGGDAGRAADRTRPAPAGGHDGLFRRLGAEGRCVLVSSHVLDEVERPGSQILVMSQGRLAAAGDFHELRALMDDRPLRVRVARTAARAGGGGARSGNRGRRPP